MPEVRREEILLDTYDMVILQWVMVTKARVSFDRHESRDFTEAIDDDEKSPRISLIIHQLARLLAISPGS